MAARTVKIENHRKSVVKGVVVDRQHWSVLLKDHHEGDVSWEAAPPPEGKGDPPRATPLTHYVLSL